MNIFIRIWEFLNGKKTIIGAVILFIATFLTEVVIGIWGATAAWLPQLISTLNWIGMPLAGGGLVHKAVKNYDTTV